MARRPVLLASRQRYTVTAWVPLQETPLELGPLVFSEGSQRLQAGRDLEISDESETNLTQALSSFRMEDSAYALGDVSFHAGWTFHRAGANSTDRPREVMTMIYMDTNVRITAPKNKNHVTTSSDGLLAFRPATSSPRR